MKRYICYAIGLVTTLVCLASVTWAAPPEDKGKANAPGQEKKALRTTGNSGDPLARGNQGGNSANAGRANGETRRADSASRRPHVDRSNRANADRATGHANKPDTTGRPSVTGRDRRPEHAGNNNEQIKADLANLAAKFQGMDNGKWWKHPSDTRGQGNLGKVLMRDPYGFDKDSDREGKDRGRPIREQAAEEPTLNIAEATTVMFEVVDGYLAELQSTLDVYLQLAEWYSDSSWYSYAIAYYEQAIAAYNPDYVKISVIDSNETIDYTLSVPDEFAGETVLVTTSLVSLSDYDDWFRSGYVDIDFDTGDWVWRSQETGALHIATGDLLVEDTQEIILNEDGTFSVSYNPPAELVGDWYGYGRDGGYMAELSVTVTDPVSGASYTTTYDRDINLYRCPYGVVYDRANGQPIAGATVTIHDATTGAIIALDQRTNPTAVNPQTTDATGRYDAKLQIGRQYYISVQVDGYDDYQSPVFSERWHVVREDIPMERGATLAHK